LTKISLNDLVNLRLLLSVDGIGPGKLRNLLKQFRSLSTILSSEYKELLSVDGISNNLAQRIIQSRTLKDETQIQVEKELSQLSKLGGRIITIWDSSFPSILKKIYDPPLMLYVIGEITEKDNYSIAIVGTRRPTNYGTVQCERMAEDLARQNITVVSGLARGIDSIAHKTALENGGRTIAVIGSGLDVIYPPENKKLFSEAAVNGAIISEYPLGTKPDAQNFPKRNRIISGLSLGCIVVETALTGGAMQTAAFALDQNREVFAIPGNLGVRQSEGTNMLIQKGEAKLIRNAEDVLVELELKFKPIIGENIPKPQVGVNLFEEKILSSLQEEPLHIDSIASATEMTTSECLVHLLSLEFKGLIKQLPGKIFSLL
jgi:DNA processing protein